MIDKTQLDIPITRALVFGVIEAYLELYGECHFNHVAKLLDVNGREGERRCYAYARKQSGVKHHYAKIKTLEGYTPLCLAHDTDPTLYLSMMAKLTGGTFEVPT